MIALPRKPPLHHRLVVRFAVVLALTMLLFGQLADSIRAAVFKALDVPAVVIVTGPQPLGKSEFPETSGIIGSLEMYLPADESAILESLSKSTSEDSVDLEALTPGIFPSTPSSTAIGERLITNGLRVDRGNYVPNTLESEEVSRELATMGMEFLWTTVSLAPLASSTPGAFLGLERIRQKDLPPHAHWYLIDGPEHAEPAGWLALWQATRPKREPMGAFGSGPGFPFNTQEGVKFVKPEEARRLEQRMQLLANLTSWTTTLIVALLLGAILSRFVTRRLEKLAAAVREFGSGTLEETATGTAAAVPLTPELIKGRDEIAQLAQAFANSRKRIGNLLDTLALRDRTRREWIAHASHDLRTPLTALSACLDRAEGLTAQSPAANEKGLKGVLSSARGDCDRLHELTDDILALAHLEASDEFTPEPLLAAELAARAQEELAPLAEAKGVSLDLDLGQSGSEGLSFDGDGRGILRVLENLLRNAIRHADSRVILRIQRSAPTSSAMRTGEMPRHDGPAKSAALAERGDQIVFEILDDGAGFGGAVLKHPSSRGIGLRVARRFVELHGGRLETGNWDGGGRAAFRLPVA